MFYFREWETNNLKNNFFVDMFLSEETTSL